MSSKREEERNEKIIRGLMKLPPNRRCINCNSMGPQYVCTNFWTFICMTCSGIHREFTHRVKSVSMAKFTSQEVDALQKGGNQRARELFMKSWDPQRQRLPDNSNIDKLRDFIKNVYVDKKYVMDKSSDKPPKDPQSLRNYEDGTRRASSYHSYSQSPPYDFQYEERRYGKHAPVLSRKPGSDRGMYDGKLASFLSPSRFSDHVTDDRFANEGSCPRFSNYSVSAVSDPFRSDIMSPSSQRDVGSPLSDTSRDFYGEVPQDRVVLPSPDLNRTSDGARVLQPQRTFSSGSFGSHDSNSMSFKSVNSLGMADMGSEPQKSTRIPLEKSSSLPALPQSSAAATFGGLNLFDASFGTQSFASSAPIGSDSQVPQSSSAQSVDLFQQAPISSVSMFIESQPSQIPQSSSLELNTMQSKQQLVSSSAEKTSDVVTPINGGWATFDMPQNFAPLGTENSAPVAETFNPFSLDQKSSYRDFSGHSSFAAANTLWHESLQNVEPKKNNDQVWNAFEDLHTVQSVLKTNEESLPNVFSDGDKFFGFGVDKDSNVGAPVDNEPPVPILSSNYSVGLSHFPVAPALADTHILATDRKPTNNPFDLPDDDVANMEPGNMFWDMSSLQDALPNPQEQASSSYVGGFDQSWLTQNPVPSFVSSAVSFDPPNGSLEFIAGQAPKPPQILAQQGPVASVGGNPFA